MTVLNTRFRSATVGAALAAGLATLAPISAHAAVITGTSGADHLKGTAAADTINGRGGDDRIWGHGGNDSITGTGRIWAGAGNDTVILAGRGDVYTGSGSNTVLSTKTDKPVRIYAEGREDVITTAGGADKIEAITPRGALVVNTGAGKDRVRVAAGNLRSVRTGSGNDVIEIEGRPSADALRSLDCGSGVDTVRVVLPGRAPKPAASRFAKSCEKVVVVSSKGKLLQRVR